MGITYLIEEAKKGKINGEEDIGCTPLEIARDYEGPHGGSQEEHGGG